MNLKAIGLLATLGTKKLGDLNPEILGTVVDALDLEIPEPGRVALLEMAASGDPTRGLVDWAKEKLEDGSFAQYLKPPTGDDYFARCPHCQQPFTINIKEMLQ